MTNIQWTDETWNVVSGCTRVSPGCDHCYIERTIPFRMQGRRFDKPGIGGTTGVVLHPDRLDKPLHWRKPRRVFVNSLSDLFHDDVPDELIWDVWEVMNKTPRHTYQVLTKRPARARSLLRQWGYTRFGVPPLPNVWIGASVEDQRRADLRLPILLEIPAAVRFLSCEPLLGPIDLRLTGSAPSLLVEATTMTWRRNIDWVIVGGESGPGARPMDIEWARSLVGQCRNADVPVFVKQLGAVWAKATAVNRYADAKGGEPAAWPEDLRVREMPAVPDAA